MARPSVHVHVVQVRLWLLMPEYVVTVVFEVKVEADDEGDAASAAWRAIDGGGGHIVHAQAMRIPEIKGDDE